MSGAEEPTLAENRKSFRLGRVEKVLLHGSHDMGVLRFLRVIPADAAPGNCLFFKILK